MRQTSSGKLIEKGEGDQGTDMAELKKRDRRILELSSKLERLEGLYKDLLDAGCSDEEGVPALKSSSGLAGRIRPGVDTGLQRNVEANTVV